MKRLLLPVLMICILLCGCQSSVSVKKYESFRETLGDDLSFTADIRAEYPDKSVEFTLACEAHGDDCTVTVQSPEFIAGTSVAFDHGKSVLRSGTVSIDTGPLDDYGLTPLSSLPTLADALRKGHADSAWSEDGKYVFMLIPDDHLTVTVWFEGSTMTPMRAEIASDGLVTVFCDIKDWR